MHLHSWHFSLILRHGTSVVQTLMLQIHASLTSMTMKRKYTRDGLQVQTNVNGTVSLAWMGRFESWNCVSLLSMLVFNVETK
jgi:hypothetical protein